MNDCKYGYATHGKTQRLSLLRAPKGPDEHADMGKANQLIILYFFLQTYLVVYRSA